MMTPSEAKDLDYLLYQHGCKTLKTAEQASQFEEGYAQGKYHFSQAPQLLEDLMLIYSINIQQICGEWLASTQDASEYGKTPLKSVTELLKRLPAPATEKT